MKNNFTSLFHIKDYMGRIKMSISVYWFFFPMLWKEMFPLKKSLVFPPIWQDFFYVLFLYTWGTLCNSLRFQSHCRICPLQQSSLRVVIKNNISNGSCSGYEEEPYNLFIFVHFFLQQYRFQKASDVTRDLQNLISF